MNKENEKVRYLPVLYTVPIWMMRIPLGNPNNNKKYGTFKYLNPLTGEYLNGRGFSRHLLKLMGEEYTPQKFYDRWFLNITVPSERPKCPYCGKELQFRDLYYGYRFTCGDKECKSKLRADINHSRYKDPREREKTGNATRENWKDAEYREKVSKGIDRYYESLTDDDRKRLSEERKKCYTEERKAKHSKWMIEAHKNGSIPTPTHGMGTSTLVHSIWEDKEFRTDSSFETAFIYYMESVFGKSVDLLREFVRIPMIKENSISGIGVYITDFYLRIGSREYVVEIKPNNLLYNPANQEKFKEAIDFCYLLGINYVIITEDFLFKGKRPYYGSLGFLIDPDAMKFIKEMMKDDEKSPGRVRHSKRNPRKKQDTSESDQS